MKTILNSYIRLLADISQLTGVALAAPDDLGMSWILSEGPALDKSVLAYLETGVEPSFPEWLSPLWRVFLESNDPKILKEVRQALLFGYKAMLEPSELQVKASQDAFIDAEIGISVWNDWFETNQSGELFRLARAYIGRIIHRCKWSEILPSHGPGAVFPPYRPSAKGCFDTIYESIDQEYPYYDYFRCLSSHNWPTVAEATKEGVKIERDIVSNLVHVPKDSRGPRLICVHPKEAIWIQQGQRRILENAITAHPTTHGRISFRDQTVNGGLALTASMSREYCTLDLKDASDRVSDKLVRFLFGGAYRWIGCARATHVKLFDGQQLPLQKFAPMGNCLTFPVESLVFWAMVRAGIKLSHGIICDEVYVFGDDILFPSVYYDGAIRGLTGAGLIVNVSKTFRKGFFRESCGVDAYKGKDVTPHRLKRWDVTDRVSLVSLCALAKNLRIAGYEETASYMYTLIRNKVGVLHLSNNPDSQGVFEYVDRDFFYLLRYEPSLHFCKKYHRWQTRIMISRPKIDPYTHSRWHVMESVLGLSHSCDKTGSSSGPLATSIVDQLHRRGADRPSERAEGLTYTYPHRVSLQRGWTPALLHRSLVRTFA